MSGVYTSVLFMYKTWLLTWPWATGSYVYVYVFIKTIRDTPRLWCLLVEMWYVMWVRSTIGRLAGEGG